MPSSDVDGAGDASRLSGVASGRCVSFGAGHLVGEYVGELEAHAVAEQGGGFAGARRPAPWRGWRCDWRGLAR